MSGVTVRGGWRGSWRGLRDRPGAGDPGILTRVGAGKVGESPALMTIAADEVPVECAGSQWKEVTGDSGLAYGKSLTWITK